MESAIAPDESIPEEQMVTVEDDREADSEDEVVAADVADDEAPQEPSPILFNDEDIRPDEDA
jgi:hypothetical protein